MHLFYPDLCIACHKRNFDILESFCFECYTELPFVDFNDLSENEFTDHFKGKINLRFGTSLFYFIKSGVIQDIIRELKYHNKDTYGVKLGQLFADTYKDTEFLRSVDIIVPVPLHPRKENKRGYNQSQRFAEGIGNKLDIPVCADNLVRIKNTMTQTKMNNEERIKNVHKAFDLLHPEQFAGKHILLVDDVLTTGSTLMECATTMIELEQTTVSMATIAIGETI